MGMIRTPFLDLGNVLQVTTLPSITSAVPLSPILNPAQNFAEFKIGETVVRGPDWRWGNQDGNSTGTVILQNHPGWVIVHWTKTGFENSYRIGVDGKYDIVPYTDPFVRPSSTSSTGAFVSSTTPSCGPSLLNKLRVGSRVQRGCDWKWGNQDGQSYGTVISIDRLLGWFKVKWDAGNTNFYRMGSEKSFDLIPAAESQFIG